MEEIKGTLRQHTLLLETLINRQHLEPVIEGNLTEFNLPLGTERDVWALEELIEDKSKKQLLVCMHDNTESLI